MEEFVLAEVVRISRALSQFHRDNAELAERTERRLEAVTTLRESLGNPSMVKLINRDQDNNISCIREFAPKRR